MDVNSFMLISPVERIFASRHVRVRTILQNEAADCGLACLAMIASAFGCQVSLAELRRRHSVSAKGMTLKAILAVADSMGLAGRPIRLELEEVSQLKTPAILHWDVNHYVILERATRTQMLIHDPATGRRWVPTQQADRSFTGVAVEFMSTPSFRAKENAEHVRLSDLFEKIYGLIPSVTQILALALVMQIFGLLSPILTQLIVDDSITRGNIELLNVLALGMFLLVLTTTGVRTLQGFIGLYMGTQLSFQMRTNLLRHVLRLPISWFEKRHVGDIVSRFGSLQPIQDVLVNSATSILLNVLVSAVAFIMMLIYSPFLSILEISAVLAVICLRGATYPYFIRRKQEEIHLDAQVQTTFLETIRGARTFKLFGQESERVTLWQNDQARLIANQVALTRLFLFGGAGLAILAGVQQIIGWYFGARMVIAASMTLGMLFAFQAYAAQFGTSIALLIGELISIRTLRLHLERLADIVHAAEERGLDRPLEPERRFDGAIALRDVGFRYGEHEAWVLRRVNLTISAGDFVCIHGPSGEGKTTLLKLILGFEEAQEGEVLVDGVELHNFGVRTFRAGIGAVMQDDSLFAGTIADNISFFDFDADVASIEAASRAAGIHQEILQFPMGYQTFTGDLGSTLSGGQRQRVLLARALYRKPKILFLDEGTANLDPASEASVMKAVAELPITRIVVAHRSGASVGANRFIEVSKRGARETAAVQ